MSKKRIAVQKWISYDETKKLRESPTPVLGGWFGFSHSAAKLTNPEDEETNAGPRWKTYISAFNEETRPYLEAIRKSVVEGNIKYTGEQHQTYENGCPQFTDGTACSMSWRAWGDLMAAIWSDEEDKDYCYMDFYMRWDEDD